MSRNYQYAYVSLGITVLVLGGIAATRPHVEDFGPAAVAEATSVTAYVDPARLQARAAVLFDPSTGDVIFGKNEERQLPLASLTKLATAATALGALPRGTTITIEPSDLLPEGESSVALGQRWDLLSLVRFTLRSSSNDASAAISRAAFPEGINDMNILASHLGLTQTYFVNPTGLDVSTSTSGAYGSALDVAKLMAYMLKAHPEALNLTVDATLPIYDLDYNLHQSVPTAESILDLPGLLGAKTGFTDLAGGNLVVAFDQGMGRPLIAVVLGSTREGRFDDIRTLIRAVRNPHP